MSCRFNAAGASFSAPESGPHQGQDNRCVPPYAVREYTATYGIPRTGCLHGRRLEHMRLYRNALHVPDHLEENLFTVVGAWIQRFAGFGGRGMTSELYVGPSTEIPFVRCTEERLYQYKAGAYIARLFGSQERPACTIYFCQLKDQYDELWWMKCPTFWKDDVRLEIRPRTHNSARVFGGWHDFEIFAIPSSLRV